MNVDTHVQDAILPGEIVGVLACEDLRAVTLVGHSYAGLLLPVIANAAAERLRQLVYLDATVAEGGLALFEHYSQTRAAFAESIHTAGEG